MKVTRTLFEVYSELVQLRSRKETVAEMALQAKADGRMEASAKLEEEYLTILQHLKELSMIEVTYEKPEMKSAFNIDKSFK